MQQQPMQQQTMQMQAMQGSNADAMPMQEMNAPMSIQDMNAHAPMGGMNAPSTMNVHPMAAHDDSIPIQMASSRVQPGKWVIITVSVDVKQGIMTTYVDGRLCSQCRELSGANLVLRGKLVVLGGGKQAQAMGGHVRRLLIHNTVLAPSQIASLAKHCQASLAPQVTSVSPAPGPPSTASKKEHHSSDERPSQNELDFKKHLMKSLKSSPSHPSGSSLLDLWDDPPSPSQNAFTAQSGQSMMGFFDAPTSRYILSDDSDPCYDPFYDSPSDW